MEQVKEIIQTQAAPIRVLFVSWHPQAQPWPEPVYAEQDLDKNGKPLPGAQNLSHFGWDPNDTVNAPNQFKQMQAYQRLAGSQRDKTTLMDARGNLSIEPGGIGMVHAEFVEGDSFKAGADFTVLEAGDLPEQYRASRFVQDERRRLVYEIANWKARRGRPPKG